ncbi:S49 family peptidase [Legionella waltersii]|uniref:Signal peptide peptidase n=1 Tax=Legionella waltersii TaxID=66969 RepID=A0A0W1AAW1_9GAMM|nr:S49 family peptidase [Legionella waltersii]KTD78424.1 signal peptide peptidase [Legionella waltersii]SNV06117.1 signal peptide peptidase [Legionella waltersii]
MNNDNSSDSQDLLKQLVMDYIQDKKKQRKWKWVRRSIIAIVILYLGYEFYDLTNEAEESTKKEHVGLIDLEGEITDSSSASADNFIKGIDKAFKNASMKAVIFRINSPGGSPVQAEYMYNTIKYYKSLRPEVKTYSVCVDMCASAAYYVAVAADEIYSSPASMVGSIGVIYNGFGFVDAIQKIGVSRRLQTSGINKGFLDPFSPTSESQQQKLQTMLDLIHKQFINRVKEGRGDRLHINEDTFSGLFWTGEQALDIGLIDGFASSGQVARDVIKINRVVDYSYKQNVVDRFVKNLGTAIADQLPVSLGLKPGLK